MSVIYCAQDRVTRLVVEIPKELFLTRSLSFVSSFPFVTRIELPSKIKHRFSAEFEGISKLKALLSLSCTKLSNDQLQVLATQLTGLVELSMAVDHYGTHYSHRGMKALINANRAQLKKLSMDFRCKNQNYEDIMDPLARERDFELLDIATSLPNLESLEIRELNAADFPLKTVSSNPKLRSLFFENCESLTDENVRFILGMLKWN